MEKSLIKSKRFWTGLIALLTSVSLILTGEKTLQAQLPLLVTTIFGIIQTIIAILSGDNLTIKGKKIS